MNKLWLLLLLPLAFVLGWVKPAQAGDITPVEGRDYWVMPSCDVGTCVKIAPDININTPLFAAKLKTTPIDIRRDNPLGTIALCHRPGDGYRMGNINKLADRADDSVWASCPNPADQYVYILPGQIIKITGKVHLSFNDRQKVLDSIEACGEDEKCACENSRKLNPKLKCGDKSQTTPPPPPPQQQVNPAPVPSATASSVPPAGASTQTAVVVSEMPAWAWKLIVGLFVIAVVYASRYYHLRYFSLEDIIMRRLMETQKEHDDIVDGLKAKAKASAQVLADRDNEIRQLTSDKLSLLTALDRLSTSLKDYAKRESVPIPKGTAVEDLCKLVTQRFLEIARDNGELKNAKLLAEKNCAEAIANLEKQVQAGEKMAARVTEQNLELEKLRGYREDNIKNRDRLAELHALLTPMDLERIKVDNELTDLYEPHQELVQEYNTLEAACDPQAALVKVEIISLEARIRPLHDRRLVLIAEAEPLREKFNSLFVQLNGFGLNDVPLYEEAQRDRNDAARILGQSKAMMAQAKALRDGTEDHLKKREAELRADMDAEYAERESQFQDKIDELVDRELKVTGREAEARALELQIKQREDYVAGLESKPAEAQAVNASQLASNGVLATELAEARENSRRFESEREKLAQQLEAAEKAHSGCAGEIFGLKSEINELSKQLATADEEVVRLQGELDSLLNQRLPTPSPVPVFPAVNAPSPPHRPTRPYEVMDTSEATRLSVKESASAECEFFDALSAILSTPGPMVVETPQHVWMLYDFLKTLKVDIRLSTLFPGGPDSTFTTTAWKKICDGYRQTAVDKVTFVVEELALKPPQGYKPLALAIGS